MKNSCMNIEKLNTDNLGGERSATLDGGWFPVSAPPKMASNEYGWPMSEPVLGLTKHGRMQVVTYEQVDEDCDPTWKSDCSERWDVTKELTHWTNLPALPSAATEPLADKLTLLAELLEEASTVIEALPPVVCTSLQVRFALADELYGASLLAKEILANPTNQN
jgi:hypothetical protein